jgi:hypothetical protein
MKTFLLALCLAAPAFAQSGGTGGGTGTDMSAPAKGSNTHGAADGANSADSNVTSHKGPDAQSTANPSASPVKGATGDVGSAKRNRKHHGSSDVGSTTGAVQDSQKNAQAPSQPSDSKEH